MLDRRGFLKFIGGAAVGTLATPVVWKGLDDISIWSQNWGWIPKLEYGNNDFTSIRTVSKLCPSAVGTEVRLVGGRPIRVVGDPQSPLSLGGVSALAAAEVQLRYSPARLKRPLLRSSDGAHKEITWEAAEKLLVEKLAASRGKARNGIVCISGDDNGSMNEILSGFASGIPAGRFFHMPSDAQTTAVAWGMMGGKGRAGFDFERSDFVLAVGANVLETWGTVISNRRTWGKARPFGQAPAMRLAYAGPVQNNTAAGADLWLPIKPGTELYLLLGIAAQLVKEGYLSQVDTALVPAQTAAGFKELVAPWTPEKVCAITGLMPERFAAVLDGVKKAKAPLVVAGSAMDEGGGVGPVRLAIAINLLLNRLNKPGGMRAIPTASPVVKGAGTYEQRMSEDLAAYVRNNAEPNLLSANVLMFYEANPVYSMPGEKIEALFKQSAFSVSFSCFLDETARRCDLVLPSALGLERYDNVVEPFAYGRFICALAQPVAKPLFEARPAGDVLLGVAKKLGMDLGVASVVDMLQAKAQGMGADWKSLTEGKAFVSDATTTGPGLVFSAEEFAALAKLAQSANPVEIPAGQLAVAFTSKLSLGTPESGIPPFNTQTITQDELAKNVLAATMNSATLRKLGMDEGTLVSLSNKAGKVVARLHVFEGVANDTVALTMGFGHKAFDAFNDGKGMNVMNLVIPADEPGFTGLSAWNDTRVSVAKA